MAAARRIIGAALAGGLIGGGAYLIDRHRQVSRALPELQVPFAYVPISYNRLTHGPLDRARHRLTRSPRPAGVECLTIPGAAGPGVVYRYLPREGRARGALLWIHGGGRITGSAAEDHALCQQAADHAGVEVYSVEYRLAPRHPYPAALDDCSAALHWMIAESVSRGLPADAVAVGGASAGGGLAAEVAQRAHDEGVRLAFQVLIYPMLDDRTVDHGAGDRGHLIWTPASNRYGWSAYLGHRVGVVESRPYAVAARRSDLSGVAPAWIGVGDLDLFYEEDCRYAERLRQAGVRAELHVVPGMYHGADALGDGGAAPVMSDFRRRAWAALSAALDEEPRPSAADGAAT